MVRQVQCCAHAVRAEFPYAGQRTGEAANHFASRIQYSGNLFFYKRLALFNHKYFLAFGSQAAYLLFGKRILGYLEHGPGAIAPGVLAQIIVLLLPMPIR